MCLSLNRTCFWVVFFTKYIQKLSSDKQNKKLILYSRGRNSIKKLILPQSQVFSTLPFFEILMLFIFPEYQLFQRFISSILMNVHMFLTFHPSYNQRFILHDIFEQWQGAVHKRRWQLRGGEEGQNLVQICRQLGVKNCPHGAGVCKKYGTSFMDGPQTSIKK